MKTEKKIKKGRKEKGARDELRRRKAAGMN